MPKEVLDLAAIRELVDLGFLAEARAASAKAGTRFDTDRFVTSAQAACHHLQQSTTRLRGDMNLAKELQTLGAAMDRAIVSGLLKDESAALNRLSSLSINAHEWLLELADQRSFPGRRRTVPIDSCGRPKTAPQSAFVQMRSLIANGGQMVPGRRRPNGKQSRPTFRWNIILPQNPKVGRPFDDASRTFIMQMRIASIAAGYEPPLRSDYRKPTNFAQLLEDLAERVGAQFKSDDIVNAWAMTHETSNLQHHRRRIIAALSKSFSAK